MNEGTDAPRLPTLREIEKRLQDGLRRESGNAPDVPLSIQSVSLVSYAQEYLRAAARLVDTDVPLTLPRLQLTGQAIELALKACLASAEVHPSNEHNLLSLYESAENAGFALREHLHFACLVHANHWFAADLDTSTRYKSRYPPKRAEGIGGTVPQHETFAIMINLLCEQARLRQPHLWPPDLTFLQGTDESREHAADGTASHDAA